MLLFSERGRGHPVRGPVSTGRSSFRIKANRDRLLRLARTVVTVGPLDGKPRGLARRGGTYFALQWGFAIDLRDVRSPNHLHPTRRWCASFSRDTSRAGRPSSTFRASSSQIYQLSESRNHLDPCHERPTFAVPTVWGVRRRHPSSFRFPISRNRVHRTCRCSGARLCHVPSRAPGVSLPTGLVNSSQITALSVFQISEPPHPYR